MMSLLAYNSGRSCKALSLLVSYLKYRTLALLATSDALRRRSAGLESCWTQPNQSLRHAIAAGSPRDCCDGVQRSLTAGAQELSMQCRQLLDDAAAARARAPMRDRITGADAVDAVAATSNG